MQECHADTLRLRTHTESLFLSVQVSTGVTLRENNLKEIEGGHILDSQGVLVGSRRALRERPGLLEVRAGGGSQHVSNFGYVLKTPLLNF